MPHNRPEPGSPEDWLRHARSDLELSRHNHGDDILLESLCFHAQQAVEKSLKAVLLFYGIEFRKTHNIKVLVDLLPVHIILDEELSEISGLTEYAVTFRYPGDEEPVTDEEYERAVYLADLTMKWAEKNINS
jgi:HEPN domain-containing protein